MGDGALGGGAGTGVVWGVGWSCALAPPQLENRTVAAIVELSKRDRRAPKRPPAKELYMVSCAPSCVIEKPSTSRRTSKFFDSFASHR